MAKTISIDDETYSELVKLTGNLMQKAGEQISIGQVTRLAIAYLKSCLSNFPRLEDEIIDLIGFEEPNIKYVSVHEVTAKWFCKDFLEVVFGIKQINNSNSSTDSIYELRTKGVLRVYSFHKGRMYEAELTDNSKVKTLHDGKEYDSLSAAARAVSGYQENGWRFWKYKDGDKYPRLMALRTTLKGEENTARA
ncbi:MAG: DUF2924 domain-containing protein [Candidatus Bathyarchaeota archaeon]